MTKRLFIYILPLLAVSFFAIGCDKNAGDDIPNVELITNEITCTFLNTQYRIKVLNGNGGYLATIDNTEIADVSIESTDDGIFLLIETKAEGNAVVTVTDAINKKTECSVTVKKNTAYAKFKIVRMNYAVDADKKEEVMIDLRDNSPYAVGYSFNLMINEPDKGHWIVKDLNDKEINQGNFTFKKEATFQQVYGLLPSNQIRAGLEFNIDFDGKHQKYDMFQMSSGLDSDYPYVQNRFYEDITEYYKAKYPDYGIKGVVRVYTCPYRAE